MTPDNSETTSMYIDPSNVTNVYQNDQTHHARQTGLYVRDHELQSSHPDVLGRKSMKTVHRMNFQFLNVHSFQTFEISQQNHKL